MIANERYAEQEQMVAVILEKCVAEYEVGSGKLEADTSGWKY